MSKVTYQVTVDFTDYQVGTSVHKATKQPYVNGHKIVDVSVVSGTVPTGIHCQIRGDKSSLFWTYEKPQAVQTPTATPAGIDPAMFAAFQAFMAMQQGNTTPVQTTPVQTTPVQVNGATALFDKWQLPQSVRDSVTQLVTLAKTTTDDKQLRSSVATTIKCFGDFRLSNEAWNTLKASV